MRFLLEGTATQATGSPVGLIITFVAMIAIFYFLMYRPQKKQEKEQQQKQYCSVIQDLSQDLQLSTVMQ